MDRKRERKEEDDVPRKKTSFNEGGSEDEEMEVETKVWNPNEEELKENEALEYDPTTYDMIHFLALDWPCLSFDILLDQGSYERTNYPHTLYLVAGSQADTRINNQLYVMKMSNLEKTKPEEDSEDSDLSELSVEDPVLEYKSISHQLGCFTRIRSMPQKPHIVGTMVDNGEACIWDLKKHINALDNPAANSKLKKNPKPIYRFPDHNSEGWAIDWSKVKAGRLVTGDCKNKIFLWNPRSSKWQVDTTPYLGHTSSVEDLKWSPTEAEVFASCSADKTVKFWDERRGKQPFTTINAHSSDVNVITWNDKRSFLLASGGDDGAIRVWDLRKAKEGKLNESVFEFTYHKKPITSVEWSTVDDACLAGTSEDNTVSFWDLSVQTTESDKESTFPPHLMFLHQGQKDVKELHYHPQIPNVIVTTAVDGFNIFKPSYI